MNVQVVVALIAFLGVVAGVVGQIVIKRMEIKQPQSPGTDATSEQVLSKLRRLRIFIIVWMLASLASLGYVIRLPESGSRWFVRVHATSVVITAASGLAILILARPGRKLVEDHPEDKPQSQDRVWQDAITYFSLLVFLIAFCYVGWLLTNWMRLSPSTQLMTAGFDLLNSDDY